MAKVIHNEKLNIFKAFNNLPNNIRILLKQNKELKSAKEVLKPFEDVRDITLGNIVKGLAVPTAAGGVIGLGVKVSKNQEKLAEETKVKKDWVAPAILGGGLLVGSVAGTVSAIPKIKQFLNTDKTLKWYESILKAKPISSSSEELKYIMKKRDEYGNSASKLLNKKNNILRHEILPRTVIGGGVGTIGGIVGSDAYQQAKMKKQAAVIPTLNKVIPKKLGFVRDLIANGMRGLQRSTTRVRPLTQTYAHPDLNTIDMSVKALNNYLVKHPGKLGKIYRNVGPGAAKLIMRNPEAAPVGFAADMAIMSLTGIPPGIIPTSKLYVASKESGKAGGRYLKNKFKKGGFDKLSAANTIGKAIRATDRPLHIALGGAIGAGSVLAYDKFKDKLKNLKNPKDTVSEGIKQEIMNNI